MQAHYYEIIIYKYLLIKKLVKIFMQINIKLDIYNITTMHLKYKFY